jgi:uncharacterized protein YcnI
MKNNRWILTATLASALLFATAGTASAHVTVWPKQSTTNAYEKYTVRVPVEKDQATTKVRLEFPAGVKVSTVKPVPGWNYEFEKDSEGRFTAITWTATNGGIKPHEFTEFDFVGKNPAEATTLSWKAYQTYADGSVVEWTGDKDSKTPASVTVIQQSTASDDHHANDKHSQHETSAEQETASSASTNNTLPLVLSGLALLLSAVSLFRKRG